VLEDGAHETEWGREAQERERGFVEDGDRDGEHGVAISSGPTCGRM